MKILDMDSQDLTQRDTRNACNATEWGSGEITPGLDTELCAVDSLRDTLNRLVAEAISYPRSSSKRQKKLNELVRLVSKSGKLWRENVPYYNDALQQMWLYFCRNVEKYNPSRSSVITWLNYRLKWELQECRFKEENKKGKFHRPYIREDGQTIDLLESLPAPPDNPLSILESTIEWVETDPEGKLKSVHIQNRPDLTCQILIRYRLPPETSWEKLKVEFGVPISTLASFYKRQCIPLLQKFGESQGYL